MPVKNPPHPGGVVLQECVEPFGPDHYARSEALGVTRNRLTEPVNGRRGISREMAWNSKGVRRHRGRLSEICAVKWRHVRSTEIPGR